MGKHRQEDERASEYAQKEVDGARLEQLLHVSSRRVEAHRQTKWPQSLSGHRSDDPVLRRALRLAHGLTEPDPQVSGRPTG